MQYTRCPQQLHPNLIYIYLELCKLITSQDGQVRETAVAVTASQRDPEYGFHTLHFTTEMQEDNGPTRSFHPATDLTRQMKCINLQLSLGQRTLAELAPSMYR